MREFFRDGDAVGEDVARLIGDLFREVERRRAAVEEKADVFVYERNGLFGDDLFRIGVDGRFLRVGFARAFLHFEHRHGAAAHADDLILLFQFHEVATKRHIRNVGELFGKLFQGHFPVFFDEQRDLVYSCAFRKRTPSFLLSCR